MKRLVFLFLILVFSKLQCYSQDARAGAILDAMSQKYKSMGSFGAAFTYNNQGAKMPTRAK